MNVLSLFDGISCAYEALLKSKKPIGNYYASEIDKNAIKVSTQNHPNIIRLGDVREIDISLLPKIDLLIGGSPCQDLSIAKKNRKGLEGDKSSLFWEYVRLLREIKPKYFILENVASMPKEDKEIITKELGVEPVLFNASLVSAQSRKRFFWTNIKFNLPEDRGILLKDILETNVDERFTVNPKPNNSQANRVYSVNGKSVCLKANGGGGGAKTGLYKINGAAIRGNTKTKTKEGIKYSDKLDVRKDEKANSLTTTFHNKLALVSSDEIIRKLTPIECERLTGLPDNYTNHIAMTNRYKCLGNAFHVDVVAHILNHL